VLMLALEGASVTLILILCFITLGNHGFALDRQQFDVSALPWSKLGLGVVVAIFSLVGFECATAFGDEAKDPLKSIPRAVWLSLVISGAFFIFVTYTMVMAVRGYATPLDQIDAPLNVMAVLAHVPVLQAPISAGAMISFFALCLSCINAGGRVIYAMGRHGIFHASTATAHSTNETPHIAVTLMALVAFGVPVLATLNHVATLDLFNYVGTCAAFGFLVPYVLITVAAPAYLKSLGQLKPVHVAGCIASLVLLAIPAVGSVYPVPPAPVMYFPYLYLAYLAVGILWILAFYKSKPSASASVRQDLQLAHDRFTAAAAE
jgi:amino acid transporter